MRCHDETFDADAVLQPVVAEVGAPRPAHDHDLDRIVARRDAELAVTVERDRAQVARRQAVRADELHADVAQLVDRVRQLHVEELRGVVRGARGDRGAGTPPGPAACRSSGCLRRLRSRSAVRASRRGSSRRPSRSARRSSRSSRWPAFRWLPFDAARGDGIGTSRQRRGRPARLSSSRTSSRRRQHGHVARRARADPQLVLREQHAVDQHALDALERKRRDGAGSEARQRRNLARRARRGLRRARRARDLRRCRPGGRRGRARAPAARRRARRAT